MYIWNINGLKNKLISEGVSDKEIFPYLLLTVALYSIPASLFWTEHNYWDYFDEVQMFIVPIIGTIFAYIKNKGRNGKNFLERYLLLNWVLLIRFMVLTVIVMIFAILVNMFITGYLKDETSWFESIALLALEILFYYRLGVHINQVAINKETI